MRLDGEPVTGLPQSDGDRAHDAHDAVSVSTSTFDELRAAVVAVNLSPSCQPP